MVRYLILPLWMLCFGLINYSAKRLVGAMPPLSKGAVELLSYFFGSAWTYALGCCWGLSASLYLVALKIMPVSIAAPVFLTLGILVATVLGWCVLREPISLRAGLGMALCLGGIVLMMK